MTILQIAERILNDERIGQRVREILQEELSADDINVVYIAETGDVYHREECTQMSKGSHRNKQYPREVSLSAAAEVGYTPCPFCCK